MQLFDSHAHLDDPDSAAGIAQQLFELRDSGWRGAVTAGYGPERFGASCALVQAGLGVHRALGLHPEWLAACGTEAGREAGWQQLGAELGGDPVVAIGEIGLDRRVRDALPIDLQIAWFERGLRLARERALPVVLHVVGWHGHALEAVRRVGVAAGGVVHRYSGPLELLHGWLELGLHLSVSLEPRDNPAKRQALVRSLPPDRLLLETDWPLLGHPYATTCAMLQDLCVAVAQARGEAPEVVAERCNSNARAVFRLEA